MFNEVEVLWLFNENSQAVQEDDNVLAVTQAELYNYNPAHVDDLHWRSVPPTQAMEAKRNGRPVVYCATEHVYMIGSLP